MVRILLFFLFCFSVAAAEAQTEEVPNSVVAPNVVKPKNQAAGQTRSAPARTAPTRQTNPKTTTTPARKNAPATTQESSEESAEEGEKKEKRRFLRFVARAADQIVMNAVGVTAAIVLVVPTIYAAATIFTGNADP